ncbi:hypothetical protein [Calothrix sp. UHCC 0171]|uniref:hypothetical protein n=1 Tax=Calothrix sp. UHCC 0171 TaxID=3110245 RepID=UPI002B20513C|nr:hypothetical protein [Calothrix sp. UHCC 0171]MEA5574191.1 hypothetical protein [Calothrix sp. UHCC 0171]
MPQGFKPQPTKIDKLVEQAVRHAQKRNPKALDQIFDNLPVKMNKRVLDGAVAVLTQDIDTLAWLCGYFAGEINSASDNDKPNQPIILISKLLIKYKMQPFVDFMPYVGCRISILDVDKFEALPAKVQEVVQAGFHAIEMTDEEMKRMNDALMEEW